MKSLKPSQVAVILALLNGCHVELTNKNAALAESLVRIDDDQDYLAAPDSSPKPEQSQERPSPPFGSTRIALETAILYYVSRLRSVRVDHGSVGVTVYANNLPGGLLSDDVREEINRVLSEYRGEGVGVRVMPMSVAPLATKPRLSAEDALVAAFHHASKVNTRKLLGTLFPDLQIRCRLHRSYSKGDPTFCAYVKGDLAAETYERLRNLLPELLTPGFRLTAINHVQEMPALAPSTNEDEYVDFI